MITQDTGFLWLTIAEEERATRGIWRFEPTDPRGVSPLSLEAGSNLTVAAPDGIHRSYSLCNDSRESYRYAAVTKRDSSGHDGSISPIDGMSTGGLIDISPPRNEFPLDECAESFTLVAGGIGITPMLSMARQLKVEGLRDFKLHYLVRNPEGTAFLDELSSDQWYSRVRIHHDLDDSTKSLDFWTLFERSKVAHIHYCGLQTLMDTIHDMTGH